MNDVDTRKLNGIFVSILDFLANAAVFILCDNFYFLSNVVAFVVCDKLNIISGTLHLFCIIHFISFYLQW